LPQPDEASRPYFEGLRRHDLTIMRCLACGAHRFPARPRCDQCWSTEFEWVRASGQGTVYSFAVMHRVYHPAFKGEAPYNLAVIELEEGPRMLANVVDCPNDRIRVGMPVEAVFDDVSDEATLVRFRPR
jgi:uncharacterized OB-fold protein